MRILIAEDDENMCKILKLYLFKEGYSVHAVNKGEDAVAYFETNQADLLIHPVQKSISPRRKTFYSVSLARQKTQAWKSAKSGSPVM